MEPEGPEDTQEGRGPFSQGTGFPEEIKGQTKLTNTCSVKEK